MLLTDAVCGLDQRGLREIAAIGVNLLTVDELVAEHLGDRRCTPNRSDAAALVGVVVRSEDAPNCVNARDMAPFLAGGQFQAGAIDPASRVLVVAFQSWLRIADTQVLVNCDDGSVLSIDHGDCFGATAVMDDPSPIVVSIPGVDDGRDERLRTVSTPWGYALRHRRRRDRW